MIDLNRVVSNRPRFASICIVGTNIVSARDPGTIGHHSVEIDHFLVRKTNYLPWQYSNDRLKLLDGEVDCAEENITLVSGVVAERLVVL